MVHTPTITDITFLDYNTDTGTGEHTTSTQTYSHKFSPSTVFYFPKTKQIKNMRPCVHTAKACPTLQNGAVAKEQPYLQK